MREFGREPERERAGERERERESERETERERERESDTQTHIVGHFFSQVGLHDEYSGYFLTGSIEHTGN